MKKILNLIKKSYWILKPLAKQISAEAKKRKVSESELMRCIIINWFEK